MANNQGNDNQIEAYCRWPGHSTRRRIAVMQHGTNRPLPAAKKDVLQCAFGDD